MRSSDNDRERNSVHLEVRAYKARVFGGSLLVFASKALSVALMCTVYSKGLKVEDEGEAGGERRLLSTTAGPPPRPPPPRTHVPTPPPGPHLGGVFGKPVQCIENPLEDADLSSGVGYTLAVTALVLGVMWLARPSAQRSGGGGENDQPCCSSLRTALTPAVPLLVLAEVLAWTWQAEILALREHLFGAEYTACMAVGAACLALGSISLGVFFKASNGDSDNIGGGRLSQALLAEQAEQAHVDEEECEEEEQEPTWRGVLLDTAVLCVAFQFSPPVDTSIPWWCVLLYLMVVAHATTRFRIFRVEHPQRGVLGAVMEIVDGVLAVVCAFTVSPTVHALFNTVFKIDDASADDGNACSSAVHRSECTPPCHWERDECEARFSHEHTAHDLTKASISFFTTCIFCQILAARAVKGWLRAGSSATKASNGCLTAGQAKSASDVRGGGGQIGAPRGTGVRGSAARRLLRKRQNMDVIFAMTRIGIGWALENVTGAFACWITVGKLDHQPDLALLITWGIAIATSTAAAVGVPRAHRRELAAHHALAENLEVHSERARGQFAKDAWY